MQWDEAGIENGIERNIKLPFLYHSYFVESEIKHLL